MKSIVLKLITVYVIFAPVIGVTSHRDIHLYVSTVSTTRNIASICALAALVIYVRICFFLQHGAPSSIHVLTKSIQCSLVQWSFWG